MRVSYDTLLQVLLYSNGKIQVLFTSVDHLCFHIWAQAEPRDTSLVLESTWT